MAISTNSKPTEKPTKWEHVYEDEETIAIWKYNSKREGMFHLHR